MSSMRIGAVAALFFFVACGSDSNGGGTPDARVGADAARVPDAATPADAAPFIDAAPTVDAPSGAIDAPPGTIDAPVTTVDARVIDAAPGIDGTQGTVDAAPAVDAAPMVDAIPTMSLVEVLPSAASRTVSTTITVLGFNIASGATLVLKNCDTPTTYDLTSGATVAANGRSMSSMLAASGTREQGLYTVTVTNPDGMTDSLVCAFLISAAQPPTVTSVTPGSAYEGAVNDGILSDQLVIITGTGFEATPAVRWTRVDGTASFEAQVVSFISRTQITAVVPSETLNMPPGDYKVTVQNPDLLTGTWSGVFTITGNAPPRITDIDPVRVTNQGCTSTSVVLTGEHFHPTDADGLFVAPSSFGCAGGTLDANGNKLCPMTVVAQTATSMTVRFSSCPGTGPWPLAVRNPDGQLGYWYSLIVTPSAEGHLNNDAFQTLSSTLNLARWKHGAAYAFDAFGHAFLYVAGGQGTAKTVLGSVEVSELSIFGLPGPFTQAQQYGGVDEMRIDNELDLPREGHTLLRAGKTLFAIGGSATISDVPAITMASKSVERAYLLSYDEMPRPRRPMEIGANGLPKGTWYYQVSAIGSWGESLGSLEVQLRTTAGGSIQVCWGAVTGATAYNIYRSLGSDGRAGTATIIAREVAAPCLVDDGEGLLAPAPGRLRGGVGAGTMPAGTYSYRVSALVGNNETYASYPAEVVLSGAGAVVLNWDPVEDATGYVVYRLEGDVYQRLDVDPPTQTTFTDNNSDTTVSEPKPEIRPLPPGSLSLWSQVSQSQFLLEARDGVDGVVIRLEQDGANDPIGRIIVAGGRSSSENTAAYHTTAESIAIGANGQLTGVWEEEAAQFDTRRAFYSLVTTQDRNVTDFPPPPEEPPCPDADGDGYIACTCAPVNVECDCVDTDPEINPGEDEICGDGIDQDCDGEDEMCVCVTDTDDDGWVSDALCNGGDCCDSGTEGGLGCNAGNAGDINPDVIEVCGDDIDQNCDGIDPDCECTIDEDSDGHLAFACNGDDCCDSGEENALGCTAMTAEGIHPDALEICGDAIDQDCDGVDPGCACTVPDQDGDDHDSLACGGDDCCDDGTEAAVGCTPGTAVDIFPGNPEICGDGIDQNCSGSDLICKQPGSIGAKVPAVDANEPVFVLALLGVSGITRNGTTSTEHPNNLVLQTMESCPVNMTTGRLNCGTSWFTQNEDVGSARESFGNDGLVYFDFVYPFVAAISESTSSSGSTRDLGSASITRHVLNNPATAVNGQIVGSNQGGSTKFAVERSHYQLLRLMSYIYVIGGWTASGPSASLERHQQ